MSFNVQNGRIYPKGIMQQGISNERKKVDNKETSFKEVFDKNIKANKEELSFSKHASLRVIERKIELNNDDMSKLNRALKKAENKGCRESVLIYKNNGFITSVQNKKVITVCDLDESDGVITNVDSVLFV